MPKVTTSQYMRFIGSEHPDDGSACRIGSTTLDIFFQPAPVSELPERFSSWGSDSSGKPLLRLSIYLFFSNGIANRGGRSSIFVIGLYPGCMAARVYGIVCEYADHISYRLKYRQVQRVA